MHELGITRNIVAIVSERAGAARVKRVSLEIGRLSAVMPEAIRFCFDVCSKGTALEGAELEIREIPGRGRCDDLLRRRRGDDHRFALAQPIRVAHDVVHIRFGRHLVA